MVGSWFCKSWKGRYDFVGPFKEKKYKFINTELGMGVNIYIG